MLKKKEHPWIDKLRIIELFEADYNASVKILMRRLLWHQLQHQIISPGTFGSIPGGSTHDAMYTRRLTFDLHRLLRNVLVLIDNDALSCYDRLIPHITAKLFTVTGLPALPAQTFFNQLLHRISNVLTGHGLSDDQIQSTPDDPLFGVGQGNGAGPAAWHCHLLIMIKALEQLHPGYHTSDPTRSLHFRQHMVSFVDDTSFILTADPAGISPLIAQAEALLNHWNTLLSFSGGALALADKTKWCLSYFKNGQPYVTEPLDDSYKIHIKTPSSPPILLHRIPPTQAERYLGVRIAVNGQTTTEYEYRLETARSFGKKIQQSTLTKHEVWVSYRAIWLPKILYCLPLTTFSLDQCNRIHFPVFNAALPKLGLNRNFPRVALYGPAKYGGLEIPNLFIEQGLEHLKWLTSFVRNPRPTSDLFYITLRFTQLEAGISTPVLKYTQQLKYITDTWISHTMAFLVQHDIQIELSSEWTPPTQRANDRCIMDIIIQQAYSTQELKHINQCRLYLQVIFLSDIYTANGQYLEPWVTQLSADYRKSTWSWPHTSPPSTHSWNIWKRAIKSTLLSNSKPVIHLGAWQRPSHQRWPHQLVTPCLPTQAILLASPTSFQTYLQRIPAYQKDILQ